MAFAVLTGSKKLQVLLAGAVATSECPITVSYNDRSTSGLNPSSTDSITTSGTAVDVVAAPPAGVRRELTGFTLYNDDTTSVTVTVRVYVNASTTRIVFYGTLLTNESVFYDDNTGWYCVNANGERKLSSQTDVVNASSQASSLAAGIVIASVNSVSSQASSIALAVIPASVNSVSSQASSLAAAIVVASVNSVSSQASSMAALVPASVSSQASLAAVVSSIYSLVSVQSFTDSTWSTASSAVSRLKTSFTW